MYCGPCVWGCVRTLFRAAEGRGDEGARMPGIASRFEQVPPLQAHAGLCETLLRLCADAARCYDSAHGHFQRRLRDIGSLFLQMIAAPRRALQSLLSASPDPAPSFCAVRVQRRHTRYTR